MMSCKRVDTLKMNFKNKVVLVTGGSSGIGAATAILFAENGANVAIVGRKEDKLKSVAATCEQKGTKCLIIKADISKEDEAKTIVDKTVKQFGRLDVLVNNAGFSKQASIFSENILPVFDEVMNTNLRAMVHITHLAVPHLTASKGNIINISSIGSIKVPQSPIFLSYCVSKAAVDHLTRCLAAELAPKGVRVNGINPGPVKTNICSNSGLTTEQEEMFWSSSKACTALNRITEADEIGELIVFLASDKARGITGSLFLTDNGMLVNQGRTISRNLEFDIL